MISRARVLDRAAAIAGLMVASLAIGHPNALARQTQGAGRISGVVVTTDEIPQPVRRAIVSLSHGRPPGYHVITGDDGRFAFDAVPAGRYQLSAARKGFVTIAYGASRPGRPGTPLVVEPGRPIVDLRVVLARGAVITGMVRDEAGEPVSDLEVRVDSRNGSGAFRPVVTVLTDDQGVYRAFGLAAGTYVVSTRPPFLGAGELWAPSDAEVDAALADLRRRRSSGVRPPVQPPVPADRAAAGAQSRQADFVPAYHPGVFARADAATVVVRAGEERAGVDIALRLMSTATVSGQVVAGDGRIPANLRVSLARTGADVSARVQPDGSFEFPSVTPGRYLLTTGVVPVDLAGKPRAAPRDSSSGACRFAAEEVWVMGDDLTGLSLVLRPCLRIAGRDRALAGSTLEPPADLSGVRVSIQRDTPAGALAALQLRVPPAVSAGGAFEIGHAGELLPGRYHLRAELPGSEPGRGWWLQSATADGRDVLDAPLELTGTSPEVTTVVFTFTDRHSSLSGVLKTPSGRPAVQYTILAFTTNRDWWRPPFRRVRTARPDTTGKYVFLDLPPGDSYVAALNDLAPDDWRDPVLLDDAARAAIRVTIGAGESKVQNLRIAGGGSP